jgi:membrane protease YdiL (CAAX protease family)
MGEQSQPPSMASKYYRVSDWRAGAASFGHAAGVVIAAFLLGILLQYVAAFALAAAGVVSIEALADPEISIPPGVNAVVAAVQFVGFGVAVYAYLRWRDVTLFEVDLPDLRDVAWTIGGFVALVLASLAVSLVIQALGVETATNQVIELGQENPVLFLYMIPVTILFVAPAEEALFRGVVQGLFRRTYGVVPAVLVASALFGVAHWLALTGGGRLTYIAVAAVLGIVLGTVYELSENLLVPIAIHGAWNAFLFGSQYLVASGAIDASGM